MLPETISTDGIRWAIAQLPRMKPNTEQAHLALVLGLSMSETGEIVLSTYQMTVLTMLPTRVLDRTLTELTTLGVIERLEMRGHLHAFRALNLGRAAAPIVPLIVRSAGGSEQ